MKKILFTLLGLSGVLPAGASAQDSSPPTATLSATKISSAIPPGFGLQASAARNKILSERDMQTAVQRAREMKALQYATAYQPMVPIPWVPEPKPVPSSSSAPTINSPQPSAPRPPQSPNAGEVEQTMMQATNQSLVEVPSNGKSGNLFSKLLGRKDRSGSIPDSSAFDVPAGAASYQDTSSLYESEALEMNQPSDVPDVSSVHPEGGSIFVNRNQGGGLLGRKDRSGSIPDPPDFDVSAGAASYQDTSPLNESEGLEMNQPSGVPDVSPVPLEGGSIFVNRNQGGGSGDSGSIKYEVDVDINGVDVILPKGSQVMILDERNGFARVRIPDGRTGIVDRSAID